VQKKERLLKTPRGEHRSELIRITDFSAESLKARRAWNDLFQALKGDNYHPTLLYPATFSFRTGGQIKTLQDKHKLKDTTDQ
jgi:hypothetical protein